MGRQMLCTESVMVVLLVSVMNGPARADTVGAGRPTTMALESSFLSIAWGMGRVKSASGDRDMPLMGSVTAGQHLYSGIHLVERFQYGAGNLEDLGVRAEQKRYGLATIGIRWTPRRSLTHPTDSAAFLLPRHYSDVLFYARVDAGALLLTRHDGKDAATSWGPCVSGALGALPLQARHFGVGLEAQLATARISSESVLLAALLLIAEVRR